MKFGVLFVACGLMAVGGPTWAQDKSPFSSTAQEAHVKPIEDTVLFFNRLLDAKNPPKRSQFETEEEYKKRIANPYNSKTIYYFRAEPLAGPRPIGEDHFKYDLKTGMLTLFGGHGRLRESRSHPSGSIPISIATETNDLPPYEATNAFGARFTITGSRDVQRVFNILNDKDFPRKTIDFQDHHIAVTIGRTREEAAGLSKRAEVIIGVQLADPKTIRTESHLTEPKFSSPYRHEYRCYSTDVFLAEVILRDAQTNTILTRMVAR